jgi:hypothetical protein
LNESTGHGVGQQDIFADRTENGSEKFLAAPEIVRRLPALGHIADDLRSPDNLSARSAYWLIACDALSKEKTFDPVDVARPLDHQDLALTTDAPSILSSALGALTIAQTRSSPRLYASKARTRASPSILPVFARRRLRDVGIDAGSTT